MKSLPAFFFPTTIICVDDDILVLAANKNLFKEHFKCNFYTKVADAQSFLNGYASQLNNINFFKKIDNFECDNFSLQSTIQLDISKILEIAQNSNRFNEISVFLSDFHMPEMNGLELCQSYHNYNFKKMLFTQANEYDIAKKALNCKQIDYFANKTDSTNALKEAVRNLAFNYFCDLSDKLITNLATDNLLPMMDPVFMAYFFEIIKDHHIIEYYLIDTNGSYLLIDENQNKHILVVHNDKSLDEFIGFISEYQDLAQYLDMLEHRKLIPFMGVQKELLDIDIAEIDKYLFNSHILNGNQPYYVALVMDIKV